MKNPKKNKRTRCSLKARLQGELYLIMVGVFVAALAFLSIRRAAKPQHVDTSGGAEVPRFYERPDAAKPFPATLSPVAFKDPVVAHAYEIAMKSPELMVQLPCYCWCSRDMRHRSLLDCYASVHAESCDICIKEALLAEAMSRAGKSADEIRAAIIHGDWKAAH